MLQELSASFTVSFEAVLSNKLRSVLTGLGIIFGVAAVIAMMAIGSGAQEEIMEQIKLVGVNNIVIKPIIEQEEGQVEATENPNTDKNNISSGLTLYDARSIEKIIPGISKTCPEVVIDTYVIRNAFRRSTKLVGIENSYFEIGGFELSEGKLFNQEHLDYGTSDCIIGSAIKSKFFSEENPLGKKIKVGNHWLKVIGVLKERYISKKYIANLGIRDYNMDIYAPINTVLVRYENRALITEAKIKIFNRTRPEDREESPNYHQLDKLTIQVAETEKLNGIAQVISKILKRKHNDIIDYEISIPELLLKQQQRTKSVFNFVLGAIAGISLLVGGIGIMNIMLASVLERIKEIGIRKAIGAKNRDIAFQFLMEAILISFTGGIIGIILGIVVAFVVASFAEIPTVVNWFPIVLSFGVAVTIGIIFGYAPARRAASQDPIMSLRYE